MAAVTDLSKSDAIFKSLINNKLKDFLKWSAFIKNRRITQKYGQWKMTAILPTSF